jgi:hypothetical protein
MRVQETVGSDGEERHMNPLDSIVGTISAGVVLALVLVVVAKTIAGI